MIWFNNGQYYNPNWFEFVQGKGVLNFEEDYIVVDGVEHDVILQWYESENELFNKLTEVLNEEEYLDYETPESLPYIG